MPAIFKVNITISKNYIVLLLKGYLNNYLTNPEFKGIQILFRFIISSFLSPYILKDQQVLRRHQSAGRVCLPPAQETSAVYLPLSYLPKPPSCRLSEIHYIVLHSLYSLSFLHPCYKHRLINYEATIKICIRKYRSNVFYSIRLLLSDDCEDIN